MGGGFPSRFGIWSIPLRTLPLPLALELAHNIEEAGFSTLWVPGGADNTVLHRISELVRSIDRVTIASGVLVIWRHSPDEVAAIRHGLTFGQRVRLVLGLGVSHREIWPDAAVKPIAALAGYIQRLRELTEPDVRPIILIGALGPAMLTLAARVADGAHPYLVTPEHTAMARRLLGPQAILAPEQAVVLNEDPSIARAIARQHLMPYLGRANYRKSWLRLGFSEEDLSRGGSDRLIDHVVAWGSPRRVAERLRAHLDAGADHVAIQVLTDSGVLQADVDWAGLAAELGS